MGNRKILTNASWIVGCKLAQSALNLIVGMLTARYLGPSGYGIVNYAASMAAFFIPLMRLGLHATLVQELGADPENEGKTLGTALTMNLSSGVLCVAAMIFTAVAINPGDRATVVICTIYSITMLFQAVEMISYWFQAKLLSKYPSMAMLAAYFVVSVYKITLLATGQNIYWFAWANVIEHGVVAVLLILTYIKIARNRLSFSGKIAKRMLSVSKYYIVSNMMVTILQQTDRLMLKTMLDETATGYYSAAVTCAGIFGFVYAALIDSFRPGIVLAAKTSRDEFEKQITILYSLVFYLSLAQCAVMTLGADWIVRILYGEAYAPAAKALRICVWYVTYAYLGSVQGIWILCTGKHGCILVQGLTGALLNVLLNWITIPHWGICGAAVASLTAQFVKNFALGFFYKPMRENNNLMIRGMNPASLKALKQFL